MRTLTATLFLVLAVGLAGCTDDEPSDASATPTDRPSVPPTESSTSEAQPALDACEVLTADDVGTILGARVEKVVAEKGCRFASPDDPGATSLGISQGELTALGGIEGAKAGITSVVEGDAVDVPGVGDAAFVVIGPTFGGSTSTGGGAVAIGSSLVQITVIPGPDVADRELQAATVDVLTLIAQKAGR